MWRSHLGEVSALTQAPSVYGSCDTAFNAVRDAFVNNFVEHNEIGGAVCITVNGRRVVDLWAGFADPQRSRAWQEDQLVNAFSVGKGVTSLVAAQCVARGEISYDTQIADVWPEFAAHDKDALTFRDALGHRVGLPAVRQQLPPFAMYDWDAMCTALANEKPWWTPGTAHGYHVNTFGFLVGEVLRRATGKTVAQLVRERIATPLNADIHLGCDSSVLSRIADFEWPGTTSPPSPPPDMTDEQLLQFNTYNNPPGMSGSGTVNTTEWRQAEIPSTNMHASARGVSAMYTVLAYGGTHNGVNLLPSSVLAEATTEVSHGLDVVLQRVSRFAHGFQIPIPERGFGPHSEAFGHYGAGGSVGFCDPVSRVGFGYVMNQMGPRWQNPRNRALIDSLYSCL
jgi:CubicO group peptidase (beta-lactamase class C family)